MKTLTVRERLIHLHQCRGIGLKTIYKMFAYDSSLSSIYSMSAAEIKQKFRISPTHIQSLYHDLHQLPVNDLLSAYRKQNIFVVTILDKEYPFLLKNIYSPPPVLYCKGDIRLLNKKSIAVVGTRFPTTYGRNAVTEIVNGLVEHDFVIVSGLARGIDGEAHIQTIKKKGKTIAVLGGGFSRIYPSEHKHLAEMIASHHLLLSEHPPHVKPHKSFFPARNWIISGLSLGTVVVEAKEKSGSLITAQFALNEGREVFAVPGSIFSSTSKGTHLLIQDGAKLIMGIDDILMELPSESCDLACYPAYPAEE